MLRKWEQRFGVRLASLVLSAPLGVFGALLLAGWIWLPIVLAGVRIENPWIDRALRVEGIVPGLAATAFVLLGLYIAFLLVASVLGFVRRLWALQTLRAAYWATYAAGFVYLYVLRRVGDVLSQMAGIDYDLEFHYSGDTVGLLRWFGVFDFRQLMGGIDDVTVFKTLYAWFWPIALMVLVVGLLHLSSWRRFAIAVYRGYHDDSDEPGDRVVEDLRTHGPDPVFRKRMYLSVLSHLLVIVIIPWLLQFGGCVTPYRVPKGSGNPVVAMVSIRKPVKKKKKKYILNPNSLVAFKVPEIDDSEIFKQVDQQTLLTYKASASAKAGRMGKGGGNTGGWPDGMEDHLVRFIRLSYDGPDWNDGMDEALNADGNFLAEFHRLTGFKVAAKGEAHKISLLRKYPKGYAPPFVYMTGSGGIRVSANDVEALREYLVGGGMLFADAGSAEFDRAFRGLARQILPGHQLLVVADDDPLFLMPYTFPHGAPPLWHHGGKQAMGIKYNNRWVVFYHPGDVNDAWKTGYSGLTRAQAEGAFEIGVNIVYYAFSNYLELTREYRR